MSILIFTLRNLHFTITQRRNKQKFHVNSNFYVNLTSILLFHSAFYIPHSALEKRREWDSNPRGPFGPCWFSRPVLSTAQPSLRKDDPSPFLWRYAISAVQAF